MVRLLSVYNNKSLLLVSEKKLTLNRDVFTSRASVVMDYDHRERIFFCWWRKKRVNEGWIEGWNFFYKLLRLSRKNHKLRCRKGLVMWESYVNCGRTECPYFSSKIKGVAEWGSQTKGWRGESSRRPKKKLWPHRFWWWKWSLTCPNELRMVLLEFKMCSSCCSYCIGCSREQESLFKLNSLASLKLIKWRW